MVYNLIHCVVMGCIAVINLILQKKSTFWITYLDVYFNIIISTVIIPPYAPYDAGYILYIFIFWFLLI